MTSRTGIGIAALVVAGLVAVLLTLTIRTPPQPIHKGKPLSAWIAQLDHHRHIIVRSPNGDKPIPEYFEDVKVLREIGTNCLPYLLQTLKLRDNALKKQLSRWSYQQQMFPKWRLESAVSKKLHVIEAFHALGPLTQPAVVPLGEMLDRSDVENDQFVIRCLGALGPTASNAVPYLTRFLQGASTWRPNVLSALASIGPAAKDAVPILIKCLDDESLRQNASAALVSLGTNAAPAVPALLECLRQTNSPIRLNCVSALRATGVLTDEIRDVLTNLLHDTDTNVRANAVALLKDGFGIRPQ
jgi:hypothetical protein